MLDRVAAIKAALGLPEHIVGALPIVCLSGLARPARLSGLARPARLSCLARWFSTKF